MYPDTDQEEVVFVYKLSSGEPKARSNALKLLHKFIKEKSKNNAVTEETLNRLSKGLHYAMWMQDKPVEQEALADNIASILEDFTEHKEAVMFVEVFINALSKEWHMVDKWRIDKFLMLQRRIIRRVFTIMAKNDFKQDVVNVYMASIFTHWISSQSKINDSLKIHFASIFWTELSKFELTKQVAQKFVDYYVNALKENRGTETYFKCVCKEVFEFFILNESGKWYEAEDEDEAMVLDEALKIEHALPVDFKYMADQLFEVGSQTTTNRKRRLVLYELSKEFNALAQGKNPRPLPEGLEDQEDD